MVWGEFVELGLDKVYGGVESTLGGCLAAWFG